MKLISDSNIMFTLSRANLKMEKSAEKKLVNEILRGNERALNHFYKHFYPSLFSFISKKINDSSDAEEILQDTFFGVLDGLRDFEFKSSLFTFICSVASHKVIDFYRKKKIKKIVFSQFENIEPILSVLLGPEDALDTQILKEKIKQTFKKLSPSYQIILKLKYIYGYSVEEIAGKLAVSFKSAESQLFRARKAFVTNYNLY